MIREATATGRTVDAAIDTACAELGLTRGDVEFEIIDMPKRGFLGLTHTPAKVKVWKDFPEQQKKPQPAPERRQAPQQQPQHAAAPAQKPQQPQRPAPQPQQKPEAQKPVAAPQPVAQPQQPAAPAPAQKPRQEAPAKPLSAQAVLAKDYLEEILRLMALENATLAVTEKEQTINIRLTGDEKGTAIGRRGETLDALQYLTSLAANRSGEQYSRVVLDSGNYRDKRRRTLEHLGRRLAGNVVKSGRSTTLEPMNPYERRIIHEAVSSVEGATSSSVGDEPNRCVIISATDAARAAAKQTGESRPPRRRPEGQGQGAQGAGQGAGGGARTGRPPRRDGRRGDFKNREKPEPYKESGKREVAPAEAQDQPLYGKIEL